MRAVELVARYWVTTTPFEGPFEATHLIVFAGESLAVKLAHELVSDDNTVYLDRLTTVPIVAIVEAVLEIQLNVLDRTRCNRRSSFPPNRVTTDCKVPVSIVAGT